jgi:hypothetical protein
MLPKRFAVVLAVIGLFQLSSLAQDHHGEMRSDAYILIKASTYRIGKTQYAQAAVSVRRESSPNTMQGVEVETCQIVAPVQGDKKNGRRTKETSCEANWPIESESDDAMKDFDVEATASSQGIGDLSAKETFKYKEMGAASLKGKATAHSH